MAPINLTLSYIDELNDQQSLLMQKTLGDVNKLFSDQISSLQKMDIFSLGCSILEVLRDGKPVMNY
jgi:hypothetical protein